MNVLYHKTLNAIFLRLGVLRLSGLLAVSVTLAACASTDSSVSNPALRNLSPEALYAQASQSLAAKNWNNATKLYEELQVRYPYGRYAQQALVEMCYAYQQNLQPAEAFATCARFLKLFPYHQHVDYVLYLQGLIKSQFASNIAQILGLESDSGLNPEDLEEAFGIFKQLVTRFPKSKYGPEAEKRMAKILVKLAQHEVSVARYYFRRGALIAAVNRAQYVLTNYSSAREESYQALGIMIEAYNQLGLSTLKEDAMQIREKNFPESSS